MPTTNPRCRLRHPAPPPLPDIAASAAPEPDPDAVPVLVSRDYSRLKVLARLWRNPDDPVGRVLTDKLGRCRVVPSGAVPAAVAVPGARVVFATEDGAPESRLLVMPEDDLWDGSTLAVSTPAGAALLGAAAGQPVEVVGRDGRRFTLRLLAVDHRPGARQAGAVPTGRRVSHSAAWARNATIGPPWDRAWSRQGGRS